MTQAFQFSDRVKYESRREWVLLGDHRWYPRRLTRKELSGHENVRLTVLLQRYNTLATPLDSVEAVEAVQDVMPLLQAQEVLEWILALLFDSDTPAEAIEGLGMEEAITHVVAFLESDEKEQQNDRHSQDGEPDIGLAVFTYARTYGVDPVKVWMDTPLWFIDAGLSSMMVLKLQESYRAAQEVQLGTGSFKNPRSDGQRMIRDWERAARPRRKTRQTGPQFVAMMSGLGVARRN